MPNCQSAELAAFKERIRGSILASACANSLAGSGVGLSRKDLMVATGFSILPDYIPGLSRSQNPAHKAGAILSETASAIALARSLLVNSGRFDQTAMRGQFEQLFTNQSFLDECGGAISLTNIRALVDADLAGPGSTKLESPVPDAIVAARSFVCGCLPGEPKSDGYLQVAKEQCLPAPADPRETAAAMVVADSVAFLVRGNRLDTESDVRHYVQRELDLANAIDGRFADAWDGIAPDLNYSQPAEDLPYSLINVQNDVTELVPTAVGIFLLFRHSLTDAIGVAALAGGKTDTVGAIVGALAGAYHGAPAIPQRWLDGIAEQRQLEEVAFAFADFWG